MLNKITLEQDWIENEKQNVVEVSVVQVLEVRFIGNKCNVLSFSYYQSSHEVSENHWKTERQLLKIFVKKWTKKYFTVKLSGFLCLLLE